MAVCKTSLPPQYYRNVYMPSCISCLQPPLAAGCGQAHVLARLYWPPAGRPGFLPFCVGAAAAAAGSASLGCGSSAVLPSSSCSSSTQASCSQSGQITTHCNKTPFLKMMNLLSAASTLSGRCGRVTNTGVKYWHTIAHPPATAQLWAAAACPPETCSSALGAGPRSAALACQLLWSEPVPGWQPGQHHQQQQGCQVQALPWVAGCALCRTGAGQGSPAHILQTGRCCLGT
jgi:hypothetical protein